MDQKRQYAAPTAVLLSSREDAERFLAEGKPKVQIADLTTRSGMPTERGIYELPPNRAGEHPLYALSSAGFIVGWDHYHNEFDFTEAVERLRGMLVREDPLIKAEAV